MGMRKKKKVGGRKQQELKKNLSLYSSNITKKERNGWNQIFFVPSIAIYKDVEQGWKYREHSAGRTHDSFIMDLAKQACLPLHHVELLLPSIYGVK